MEHLTEERLKALLANAESQAALREHLKAPCETCEAFLAEHEVAGLDGLVDLAALGPLVSASAPLDEVGWQRLKRTLKPPRRNARLVGTLVALAAGLAVALGFTLTRPHGPSGVTEEGVKGRPSDLRLELIAAAKSADGSFYRISEGAQVPQSSTLVFRYTVNEPAGATMWLVREHGTPQRLGTVNLEAGTHELMGSDGALVGVSMQGEVGQISVVVVPGQSAGPEEAPRALGRLESDLPSAVGRVTVHVQP